MTRGPRRLNGRSSLLPMLTRRGPHSIRQFVTRTRSQYPEFRCSAAGRSLRLAWSDVKKPVTAPGGCNPDGNYWSVMRLLDQAHPRGFWTLPALDDINNDGLPLAEPLDARSLKSRDVDKHIFAAAIRSDETVSPF